MDIKSLRRVVTGHDAQGRSTVFIDATVSNVFSPRPGAAFSVIWSSDGGFPVSNDFGISSVPTMFLVERDGTISQVFEGWRRKEIEWLGEKAGVRPIQQGENVPEWKAG